MNKYRVMTILGTRPEIIRLSSIIKKMDQFFDHILVHTGQNWDYNLNQIFFDDLGIRKPDVFLSAVGNSLGETLGNIISLSFGVLESYKPDALLVLGDTNSSLSAIPAKRLKIPIFHMEAGNRCWDWNVPEMINRKIVDHISDINLPYTENSRRYLLNEGIDGKFISVTGSPMYEVINDNRQKINVSDVLERLSLFKRNYILVSTHREENIDNNDKFNTLVSSINKLCDTFMMPIVFSLHPRTRNKIQSRGIVFSENVLFSAPFSFSDYIKLQENAFCVLSDSGTLSEESAILGFPAVLIRTSTERPEAVDYGTIVIGDIEFTSIYNSILLATSLTIKTVPQEYLRPNVSEIVAKIIQGNIGIINKVTWNKF